jgi:hypothetical protein
LRRDNANPVAPTTRRSGNTVVIVRSRADADTGDGGMQSQARSRGRRGYWIPGIIALTVLVAIAIGFGAGDLTHPSPRTLAGQDVEAELSLGIQAQQGSSSPPVVHCPGSEPVLAGHAFSCTLVTGESTEVVSVVEIDRRGRLRWSITPPLPQATG